MIRNKRQYAAALDVVSTLMDQDPEAGSPEADRLELKMLLIEQYEKTQFPVALPTPVEAIKFRMEQEALAPRDLVPFLGSRSKVSEVLSGKRQLSLSMMRALHAGLNIPADVLLQEPSST